MLEHCDKCLLKWFAANVDLETLKYQHLVIQHSLRSQRHQKEENEVSLFSQDLFFPKHVRGGILPLHGVGEQRGKEGEGFLSYSKWKGVVWPCFTCRSSNVDSPPLGWWKGVCSWAAKEFRAFMVLMASSRNAWQSWRESFSPGTMVTTNLYIKNSLHRFLVP